MRTTQENIEFINEQLEKVKERMEVSPTHAQLQIECWKDRYGYEEVLTYLKKRSANAPKLGTVSVVGKETETAIIGFLKEKDASVPLGALKAYVKENVPNTTPYTFANTLERLRYHKIVASSGYGYYALVEKLEEKL